MNFGFTEEQELLRDQVRKFLQKQSPLSEVRKIMDGSDDFSSELWKEMGELGWLGLLVPEEFGGIGLGWIDLVVLLEESGRVLLPSPMISHMLAVSAIVESDNQSLKERLLPEMAAGTSIGSVAILEQSNCLDLESIELKGESHSQGFALTGEKHFVADANAASVVVVAFKHGSGENDYSLGLIEADAEGVTVKTGLSMDQTKADGAFYFENANLSADNILASGKQAKELIQRLLDCGAVAVTAEAIGSAEAAVEITNEYAKERIQFGAPIGKYQGVKHPLAEMYVDIESFKSLLYYAAWTVNESRDELPRSISLAKAYASDAFANIGINCIQLHGAIGYTAEYDIQLFLKRSKWMRPAFGDSTYHYDRIATLGGV